MKKARHWHYIGLSRLRAILYRCLALVSEPFQKKICWKLVVIVVVVFAEEETFYACQNHCHRHENCRKRHQFKKIATISIQWRIKFLQVIQFERVGYCIACENNVKYLKDNRYFISPSLASPMKTNLSETSEQFGTKLRRKKWQLSLTIFLSWILFKERNP